MAVRLPAPPRPPGHGPAAGPGPVVVFLPAHDEEATVAAVVARVPALVLGRRVECLVVDDGSGDRTAELAAAAGATVLSVATNRGLGAAVRLGLAAAVERGAAAVAFCDADHEYDPAELERLVGPILEGRADYVVGSRFAGEIRRMLPQRRLGNLALTALLRFVARAPIGDGQSGFRALSRAADQAAWSKAPSGARASAAAQAMARAWWVLSWTNRPRRPKLSRAGWAAAQASRAWNAVA